ncbi:nitroreductase [Sphingobium sp. JS3065]|uniref:nitroreductase n=1 Tax=Sphingobium sp. JS3065 TaxID=2970925 RepID=UPI0022649B98|nr:nitroreductase [Sphingobium sp. JS3065]UZW56000.1 nitroreductase [Sphingobium sp. JS3065]
MDVREALHARQSTRGFLDRPVAPDLLASIFEAAQRAPSNCNTQPWQTIVVSGKARDQLARLLAEHLAGGASPAPDFGPSVLPAFEGVYRDRQHAAAAELYAAMGIERGDKVARAQASQRNWAFFGAPHVALFTMQRGLGLMGAVDVGGYAHGLALMMTASGIGSCPQASLAYFPAPIREYLDIPVNMGILFGMSFGYPDPDAPSNRARTGRAAVIDAVRLVE